MEDVGEARGSQAHAKTEGRADTGGAVGKNCPLTLPQAEAKPLVGE